MSETSSRIATSNRLQRSRRPVLEDAAENNILSNPAIDGNDLGEILQQVDNISQSISSESGDRQKVSEALQLTVTCAVRQTLMERELRALALTDDLTGLYNRRGFLVSATQQLKLAHRNSQEVLLLFCDVDDLKSINDSYGHLEGDRALIQIADALVETFRSSDILARLGGDEFAVLALETSNHYHELLFDRLNEHLTKAGAKEARYRLSLSIGVARLDPGQPVSLAQLMLQADQAMYERKKMRSRKVMMETREETIAQSKRGCPSTH
jgi:diguanylate cyclase (GGDEF)-like protein